MKAKIFDGVLPGLLPLAVSFSLVQAEKHSDYISAEISVGELIDKITILEIKSNRIHDQKKLKNIHTELETLSETLETLSIVQSNVLEHLKDELLHINETLWDIEDAIREKEQKKEFDETFIQLARSVYVFNDERGKIKRTINELTGSRLVEEKSYTAYEKPIDSPMLALVLKDKTQ